MTSTSYEPAFCAVCGHADAEVIADRESLRADVEALWAYHGRRLRAETPPERLMDRVAFSEHPPVQLVQCRACGLVYRNPVERTHELREIYAGDDPPHDLLRALHATQLPAVRRQARRLRRVMGRGGTGLEVGSYVAAFLSAARESGFRVEGLDVNARVNAFGRSLGFTIHDGELATTAFDRRYDVVAIWNTFDQLAEPRSAVVAARRLLHDGGFLVIRVPNGEFYAAMRARMRRGGAVSRAWARALLAQNNLLTFPYRAAFGPRSLRRLLEDVGFAVVHVHGDVLVPIADEWTRGWARVEERVIKRALAPIAARDPRKAPWIEMYARRS